MGTKKRGNGQGSVYKMKNGKWRAEWTIGYKMDGSRISKRKGGFSTKKDAMKFLESEKSQPSYESINIQEVYKIISADIEKLSKDKQRAYDIAYRRIRPIWFRNISDIRIPELQYIVDTATGDFYPKRDIKACSCQRLSAKGLCVIYKIAKMPRTEKRNIYRYRYSYHVEKLQPFLCRFC